MIPVDPEETPPPIADAESEDRSYAILLSPSFTAFAAGLDVAEG